MQLGHSHGDRLTTNGFLRIGEYLTATDGHYTYHAVMAPNGDVATSRGTTPTRSACVTTAPWSS